MGWAEPSPRAGRDRKPAEAETELKGLHQKLIAKPDRKEAAGHVGRRRKPFGTEGDEHAVSELVRQS